MALTITNNVASLTAQDNLTRTSTGLSKTLERLSSGLKINRGADGPAALVISEEQRAQISGLQSAINNTTKGVALVQTTEGALNEINSLLVKIRGLSLDSANGAVNDANALAANQAEVANALATIDRIASNTQFGTKKVLDGSAGFNGTSSNTNVAFLRATSDSQAGSYSVNITQAAQRASITAGNIQTVGLAQNETLTINGVQVQLNAGQSQDQVVSTINAASGQTGVVASKLVLGKQTGITYTSAQRVTSGTALTTGGGATKATNTDLLINLDSSTATAVTANDQIIISGYKADGTAATTTTFTITNTNTVADLLAAIKQAFGPGYNASIAADGEITLKNTNAGDTANALSLSLTYTPTAAGSAGSTPTADISFGTFANNGLTTSSPITTNTKLDDLAQTTVDFSDNTVDALAFLATDSTGAPITIANQAVDRTTTIGDVLGTLQAAFTGPGDTVSFQGGKFVYTNPTIDTSKVSFSLADAGGSDIGRLTNSGTVTDAGELVLRTVNYGAGATINVQSNLNAADNTTGIGSTTLRSSGVDVAGTLGGFKANGQGNILTGDASDGARGISVAVNGLAPHTPGVPDGISTVAGPQGAVSVADNSLVFQIGANAAQTAKIAVDNASTAALGLNVQGSQFANLAAVDIRTQSGAEDTLRVVDQAIGEISTLRGRLGAFQANTLESTANNLRTTLENTTAAESVIRDTDFAVETANFTKYQVLVQAGSTVLSNANQTSQLVLSLLNGR